MSENPFLKALEVLDERGWYQGDFVGPDGGVCIWGAMNQACEGSPDVQVQGPAVDALLNTARNTLGISALPHRLVEWNDAEGTTEEDVRLLLKQAAYSWEEE